MPGKELVDLSVIESFVTLLGSGLLTLLGLGAEWNGIQHLLHHEATVGIWLAFVGSIALYLGVVELGWKEVLAS
jgi:divalent metal cation (Fe/Co/Zn/Cd) transporter